jgi:hypothetical protein
MIAKNILTDLEVADAKPNCKPVKVGSKAGSSSEAPPATVPIDKDYKLSDGGGLYTRSMEPLLTMSWPGVFRPHSSQGALWSGVDLSVFMHREDTRDSEGTGPGNEIRR